MRLAKSMLLWAVRALLALLVFVEVYLAFKLVDNFQRAGINGVRDFICFHMKPVAELRWHTSEELVREAQRGYEFFAFLVTGLTSLTWLSFRADKRIRAWMRQDAATLNAGEVKQQPGN